MTVIQCYTIKVTNMTFTCYLNVYYSYDYDNRFDKYYFKYIDFVQVLGIWYTYVINVTVMNNNIVPDD